MNLVNKWLWNLRFKNIKIHVILLNPTCFLSLLIDIYVLEKNSCFPSSPVKFWIDTVYIRVSLIIGIAAHSELFFSHRVKHDLFGRRVLILICMPPFLFSHDSLQHGKRKSKSYKKKYTTWRLLKLRTSLLTGEFWLTAGCAHVAYGHFWGTDSSLPSREWLLVLHYCSGNTLVMIMKGRVPWNL